MCYTTSLSLDLLNSKKVSRRPKGMSNISNSKQTWDLSQIVILHQAYLGFGSNPSSLSRQNMIVS